MADDKTLEQVEQEVFGVPAKDRPKDLVALEQQLGLTPGKGIQDLPLSDRLDIIVPSELPQVVPEPDFYDKVYRSWNTGWGSVKTSFGAGLEWVGNEQDSQALTEFGRELRERGAFEMAANQLPNQEIKEFEWSDMVTSEWWATKAPQILPSMLSLIGPSFISGVASTIATEQIIIPALAPLVGIAAAEPTPIGEALLGAAATIPGLVAGAVGAATVSRTLEGVMEAGGVYEQVISELKRTRPDLTTEEVVEIASAAASETFKGGYSLLALDALQHGFAFSKFSKFGKLGEFTKEIPKAARISGNFIGQMGTESFEEGWQSWISSQAMNRAKGMPEQTFEEWWAVPENKEAVALGAVGGAFFGGLGELTGSIGNLLDGKKNEIAKQAKKLQKHATDIQNAPSQEVIEQLEKDFARDTLISSIVDGKEKYVRESLNDHVGREVVDKDQQTQKLSEIDRISKIYSDITKNKIVEDNVAKEAISKILQRQDVESEIEQQKAELEKDGTDKDITKATIESLEEQTKDLSRDIRDLLNGKKEADPEPFEDVTARGEQFDHTIEVGQEVLVTDPKFAPLQKEVQPTKITDIQEDPNTGQTFVQTEASPTFVPIEQVFPSVEENVEALKAGEKPTKDIPIERVKTDVQVLAEEEPIPVEEIEVAVEEEEEMAKPPVQRTQERLEEEGIEVTPAVTTEGKEFKNRARLSGMVELGEREEKGVITKEEQQQLNAARKLEVGDEVSLSLLPKGTILGGKKFDTAIEIVHEGQRVGFIRDPRQEGGFKDITDLAEQLEQGKEFVGVVNKKGRVSAEFDLLEVKISKEEKVKAPEIPEEAEIEEPIFKAREATEEEKKQEQEFIDKMIEEAEKLKIDTKGKLHDATLGIPITIYNGMIDVFIATLKATKSLKQAINRAINFLRTAKDDKGNHWFRGLTKSMQKNVIEKVSKKFEDTFGRTRRTTLFGQALIQSIDEDGELVLTGDINEEESHASGTHFGENDNKAYVEVNKIRFMYQDIEGFKNSEVEEKLLELSSLVIEGESIEKDIIDNLDKISREDPLTAAIWEKLKGFEEAEIISLFNTFKSVNQVPSIWMHNRGDNVVGGKRIEGQKVFSIAQSNKNDEISREIKSTFDAYFEEGKRAEMTQERWEKFYSKYQQTRLLKKKSRPEKLEYDIQKAVEFTGLPRDIWVAYLNNQTGPREANQTFEEWWISGAGRRFEHTVISLPGTGIILENFKNFRQLNNLNQIADGVLKFGGNSLVKKLFKGVAGNTVSSWILDSQIFIDAKNYLKKTAQYFTANPYVKFHKEKGRTVLPIYTLDGVKNTTENTAKGVGNIEENDLKLFSYTAFLNSRAVAEENEYLQILNQLSDKKQPFLINVEKRELKIAREEFIRLRNKNPKSLPTNAELEKQLNDIKSDLKKIVSEKQISNDLLNKNNIDEVANAYLYNYALNDFYVSRFFFGEEIANQVTERKRLGPRASSGKRLNTDIEDGVGKTSNFAIISDIKGQVKLGNVASAKDFEKTDGHIIMTEEYAQKLQNSAGSLDGTMPLAKLMYSKVADDGSSLILKGMNITLTNELSKVNDQLSNLKDWMKKNKLDYVVFESAAKLAKPNQITNLFSSKGKIRSNTIPKVQVADNNYFVISQDFNKVSELSIAKLARQQFRNFIKFESYPEVQKLINKVTEIEAERFLQKIKGLTFKQFKKEILDNIANTPENELIRSIVEVADGFNHPYLVNYIPRIIGSIVTQNVLNLNGNFSQLYSIPDISQSLATFKKGKKGVGNELPEAMVPESWKNQGFEIGDEFFHTRVPSTELHSTTLFKIKGFLPDNAGNIIMVDSGSQFAAGEDYDGDSRFIWGLTKDANGRILNVKDNPNDTRAMMNEAFNLIASEYKNYKNYERITTPLSGKDIESVTDKIKEKEKEINRYLPQSFYNAYKANRFGKSSISRLANAKAGQTYLNMADVSLRGAIQFPLLDNKGKIEEEINLSSFSKDGFINNIQANIISEAVDNANNQNLEAMGVNEDNSHLYMMMVPLIADTIKDPAQVQKILIDFFNIPIIREYYKNVQEAKSINSDIDPFSVMDNMIQFRSRDLTQLEIESGITTGPKGSDLYYLDILKRLNIVASSYNKIISTIKANEKAALDPSELHNLSSNIAKVLENKLQLNISGLENTGLYEPSKEGIRVTTNFLDKYILSISARSEEIITHIENMNNKNMSKEQYETLIRAINNYSFAEWMKDKKGRKKIAEEATTIIRNNKDNPFVKLLSVKKDAAEDISKVGIKEIYKRIDIKEEDILNARQGFAKLSKEEKDTLILHAFYEYGITVSVKTGGFSKLFDLSTHSRISTGLENARENWTKNPEVSDKMIDTIITRNPSLAPMYRARRGDASRFTVKGVDGVMPKFIRFQEPDGVYLYIRKSKNEKTFYTDTASKKVSKIGRPIYQPFVDKKIDGDPKGTSKGSNRPKNMLVKSTDEELALVNPELFKATIDRFKELFPAVNIRFITDWYDSQGTEILGAAAGNTIYIDRKKAVQSTGFHEMAHLYWDALPENDAIKVSLLNLFEGNEENAIIHIGLAGIDQAAIELQGATLDKFKRLLRMFWSRIKKLFNVASEKDFARIMADRIWNNSDRITEFTLENNVMKYMKRFNTSLENEAIEERKAVHEERIGKLEKAIKGKLSDITGKKLNDTVNSQEELTEKELAMSFWERAYREYLIAGGQVRGLDPKLNKKGDIIGMSIENYAIRKYERHIDKIKDREGLEREYKRYTDGFKKSLKYRRKWLTEEDLYKATKFELIDAINDLMVEDNIAVDFTLAAIINRYGASVVANNVKRESTEPIENSKPWTNFMYEMVFEDTITDMGSMLGGKANLLIAPDDVRQKGAQLRQHMLVENQNKAQAEFNTIKAKLQKLKAKIPDKLFEEAVIIDTDKQGRVHKFFIDERGQRFKDLAKIAKGGKELQEWIKTRNKFMRDLSNIPEGSLEFRKIALQEADLPEMISSHGVFKTLKQKLRPSAQILDIAVKIAPDKIMTIKEYKKELEAQENQGIITKTYNLFKLKRAESKALDIIKNKKFDDAGNIIVKEERKIRATREVGNLEFATKNIAEGSLKQLENISYKFHLEPIAPMLEFIRNFYGKSNKDNLKKYLDMMDDAVLYGEKPRSFFGPMGEFIQMLVNITAFRYLGLNLLGAQFNVMAGITQNIREIGFRATMYGLYRMMANFDVPRGFKKGEFLPKAINIIRNMEIVQTSEDTELSVSSRLGKTVSNFIFSPITVAEYFNQGITIFSQLRDHEIALFNRDGTLKDPEKKISEDRWEEILTRVKTIHGAYHPFNKRPITYTPEGRMIMQFKNWLPDVFLAHWRRPDEDINTLKRKGILNTVIDKGPVKLYKSVFQKRSTAEIKKAWNELSAIDKINLRKFMRELVMMGALALLISSLDEDDKDNRKKLKRIMGDIGFIYDMDNFVFLLDAPAPAFGTATELLEVLNESFKVVTGRGETYKRDTRQAEKGDLKAPVLISNFLPITRQLPRIYKEFGIEE